MKNGLQSNQTDGDGINGRPAPLPLRTAKKQPRRSVGRPFPPGVSGNPGGRPRAAADFRAEIQTFLNHPGEDARRRVNELIERLYKDDPKLLLYYAYGKPVEIHEVTHPEGVPQFSPEVMAAAREIARGL